MTARLRYFGWRTDQSWTYAVGPLLPFLYIGCSIACRRNARDPFRPDEIRITATFGPFKDVVLGRRLAVAVKRIPSAEGRLVVPMVLGDSRVRPVFVGHRPAMTGAALAMGLPATRVLTASSSILGSADAGASKVAVLDPYLSP